MSDSLLLSTARNLVPLGVFLRSANVLVHDDYNRHNCRDAELEVNFKGGPGSEYKVLSDEEGQEGIMLFQFEAGVRLVDPLIEPESDEFVKVEITATFESEYQLVDSNEFNEDGMSLFLNRNVPHQVWPYWREYVQSTCARLGVPEIVVPFKIQGSSILGQEDK